MWSAVHGFWLLLVMSALAAWGWGGRNERLVANAYLLASLATLLFRLPGSSDYARLDIGVFATDLGLLVFLLWLVARTPRWWLISSAALQLVTVLGHVAMFDAPRTHPFAYFMMAVSSSYPAVLLLGYATWRRRPRRTQSTAQGCVPSQIENERNSPGY